MLLLLVGFLLFCGLTGRNATALRALPNFLVYLESYFIAILRAKDTLLICQVTNGIYDVAGRHEDPPRAIPYCF